MGVTDNSRIARNTLFLYARTFITMLVGLYTSRRILEVLGVEDYGIYNVVGGVIVLLTFLNGSMSVAIGRYLTVELGRKDLAGYNRVFNISLLIQLGLAAALLILGETVGLWFVNAKLVLPASRMVAANWVYQASILTTVLSIICSPFAATINAHERMHIYAYTSLGESLARLAIVMGLGLVPWDKLSTWAIMLTTIQLLSLSFQIGYCRHEFPHCAIKPHWDKSLFRQMAGFSGWNLFGTVAWTLKDQGVNIVLNLFGGAAINAARGVAMQVKSATLSLTGGFQAAVSPQLTKNIAVGDIEATRSLMFKSSKLAFFLLLLLGLPVCYEASFLLGLWLVKVPAYATMFTILVIIETLADVFSGITITGLMATGRIRNYQIVVGLIMLLNVPVAYLLLWLGLPIYVPFIVSILVTVAGQTARLAFVQHQISIRMTDYLRAVVARCLAVTILSAIPTTAIYLLTPHGWLQLIAVAAVSTASIAASAWWIGLTQPERLFLSNLISSKLHHLRKPKPENA